MGGKPSPGTPKDKRLSANKKATSKPSAKSAAAPLKFGSPAWRAKYGK